MNWDKQTRKGRMTKKRKGAKYHFVNGALHIETRDCKHYIISWRGVTRVR